MIRLFLIRHGETAWNSQKRFQGWSDIELNEKGFHQAELLGKRFENIKVDELYSSPLIRAVQTAMPIAKAQGVEIQTNEYFKEINFGEWEGKTREEIAEAFGDAFEVFIKNPQYLPFPGEGSFDNVIKRIKIGLDEIMEGKDNINIAIVSHGGIIRLMIRYLLDIKEDLYNRTWIDNTSISVVEVGRRETVLRVLNDSSHIPDNGVI